eukprot:147824_1
MGCFCSRSGDPVGDGDLEEQLVLSPPNLFEQFDRGSLVTYFLIFMGIVAFLAFAVYLGSNDSSYDNPLSLPPLVVMLTGSGEKYLRTPWNNSKLTDEDRDKMVANLKRTIRNEREFKELMGPTRSVDEFIRFLGNANEIKSQKRQPFFPSDNPKSDGTLRFIMDLALEMKSFDVKELSFITDAETRRFTDKQCARLLAASFL